MVSLKVRSAEATTQDRVGLNKPSNFLELQRHCTRNGLRLAC